MIIDEEKKSGSSSLEGEHCLSGAEGMQAAYLDMASAFNAGKLCIEIYTRVR